MKLTLEPDKSRELEVIIRGNIDDPDFPRIIAALNQSKVWSKLFLYSDGRAFLTSVSSIKYFEAEQGHVFAYTSDGKMEVKHKLYELCDMLRPSGFIQINKGVIVNVHEVMSVEPEFSGNYTASLCGKAGTLTISRSYFKSFKNYVEKEL